MELHGVPGGWVAEEGAVPQYADGFGGYYGYAPVHDPMFDAVHMHGVGKEVMQPVQPVQEVKQVMHAVPAVYGYEAQYGAVPAYAAPAAVPAVVPAVVPAPAQAPAPVPAAARTPEPQTSREEETAKLRLKPRWETPRRRGSWTERWEGARSLGADSVPVETSSRTAASIRNFVAKIVHLNVGLPIGTVEKWFHLLAEYLELSADEHVLMAALFRKYMAAQGPLLSPHDWARPQKWECVLAISCYLSVLLSEEFAGQTARELKELLGPSFRFGAEQTSYLKQIDWRINISQEEFEAARVLFVNNDSSQGAAERLHSWFFDGLKTPAAAAPKADKAAGRKRSRTTTDDALAPKRREVAYDDAQTVPSWN